MNESELVAKLQNDYPELSAHVIQLGVNEGVNEGVQQERARIVALLPATPKTELGRLVCKNISEGREFENPLVKANYLCIQLKENQTQARQIAGSEKVVSFLEFRAGVHHEKHSG